MNKKSLILLLVLSINSAIVFADSNLPPLPDLPKTDITEIIEPSKTDEISFLEKIKDFFGFGKKDDKKISEIKKTDPNLDLLLPTINEDDTSAHDVPLEISESTEEGPVQNPSTPFKNNANTDNAIPAFTESDDELKLPDGFEELLNDLEENDTKSLETKEDEVVDSNHESDSATRESSEESKEKTLLLKEVEPKNDIDSISEPGTEKLSIDNNQIIESTDKKNDQISPEPSINQEQELNQPSSNGVTSTDTVTVTEEKQTENAISTETNKEIINPNTEMPNYTSEAKNEKAESDILKYQNQILSKKESPEEIKKITPKDFKSTIPKIENYNNITKAELSSEQIEFVKNEAQVLILPNDDVVEGELTQDAKIDLMDFRLYVQLFWKQYNKIKNEPLSKKVENFIEDYEDNFGKNDNFTDAQIFTALDNAFIAIEQNKIASLILLVDHYPIIQLTDNTGNTLLHKAAHIGNYNAAKFLLVKGINIYAKNDSGKTALDLAMLRKNKDIIKLLKSA